MIVNNLIITTLGKFISRDNIKYLTYNGTADTYAVVIPEISADLTDDHRYSVR